jgi:hypothetical protein
MPRFRVGLSVLAVGLVTGCGGGNSSGLFAGRGNSGGATSSSGGDTATGGVTESGGATSVDTGGAVSSGGTDQSSGGGAGSVADAAVPPSMDAGDIDPTACLVGHYTGTLLGSYKTAATILPATLTLNLPLDLYLSAGSTPGYLDLDASGTGSYLFVPYSGHITGHLNCKTGVVKDGKIVGSYGSGGGTTSFQGTVEGALDRSSDAFSGTWNGKEANPAYGGDGTWTASHA